ncbi:MAG: glycoside hydrolase family 88 protein, partial [Gammaproteobacteria bacterium]|nr:glycoside hydrolase family 88 protein [Gammaproteobacteria bacterium]
MKKVFTFIAASVVLWGCGDTVETPVATTVPQAEVVATLEVSNPSKFSRPDTLLEFSLHELGVTSGPLQVWQGEIAQASQLVDDNADGAPDRLVFLTDLAAASVQTYVIDRRPETQNFDARTQAEVSIKENGEWQGQTYVGGTFKNVSHVTTPAQYTDHSEYIRYEGPGIESDAVGYRIYLDWRNGFDIFGKKKPGLVLQDIGQDGYASYHEMSDWGADILKVGKSLGMGGYGYWDGSKTVLVSEVDQRSVTIQSSGPIHSSIDIDYQGWNTGDTSVDMKATLAMQAGSPLVDVGLVTSSPLDNIAIGLVAQPETELFMGDLNVTGEAWSYMATFGEQTLFDGKLGMAVLFRKNDMAKQTRDKNSHVLVMKPRGTELSYAFGALWSDAENGVQTREELESFLAGEVEKRTLPPRVRLKTEVSDKVTSLAPLAVARELAASELQRRGDGLSYGGWDVVRSRESKWSYTTGLLMEAMDDMGKATGDKQFADYARRTIDSYLDDEGSILTYDANSFNIDNINSGKMLQRLYARHGDAKYLAAIETLAAQMEEHPRTSEGAFWHKLR